MNITGVDLNLFLVLHAVLKERSATRAARRLNLTQSAVSNALVRLRATFQDPLVVRSGRGFTPTPRAMELWPALESAIGQLQLTLSHPGADPAQVTRRFTLACADSCQICDIPKLAAVFALQMPRAGLRVVSNEFLFASNGLESGEVDALIATKRAAKGLNFAELYQEGGVLIMRCDHPYARKRLSREIFNSLQHIDVMTTSGQAGATRKLYETVLKKHQMHRHVVLTVPTFAAAAIAVARTDYVAGIPRGAALALSTYLPLKLVSLPFKDFFADVALIWHSRTELDPIARAFREIVIQTLRRPKAGKD